MDPPQEQKFSLKVLVIGEAGVGKSAIIQKYVSNFYPDMYKQSLGCNFFAKSIELPNNSTGNLNIWDCSSNIFGESLKSKMLKTYIFGSNIVLFVYDITNKSSFEQIPNLMKLVKGVLNGSDKVQYSLLGNKNDLFNQIAVEEEQAQNISKTLGIDYYSVSAKTGNNLNECFRISCCKACNLPFEKKSEKEEQSAQKESMVDLRGEVKGKQQQSTSSTCTIF